jgi:hypothetical protein
MCLLWLKVCHQCKGSHQVACLPIKHFVRRDAELFTNKVRHQDWVRLDRPTRRQPLGVES